MLQPSHWVSPVRCLVLVATAVFLLILVPALVAQQPQAPSDQAPPRPVFRGGVEFVSVDVFPRRGGEVVEGLTVADFVVTEDGTPQTIESFEFVRIDPNTVDSDRRDPTSQADGDAQAADPRSRVFVVYLDLDNVTVAGGNQARAPVVDFLNRAIGARDLFAVTTPLTPAGQLAFGRRLETVERELERYWTWGRADRLEALASARSPYEERLLDCVDAISIDQLSQLPYASDAGENLRAIGHLMMELNRDDQQMTHLENLMARLGALRDERKNVLLISEGFVPAGPHDELRGLTFGTAGERGAAPSIWGRPGGSLGLAQTNPYAGVDLAWCESEARRLALMDFRERFRAMLVAAAQANVSFYPVDVGGLRTTSRPGGAIDTLRTLAENTDGFAIVGTNDLMGSVRRIEQDLSAYYLLGYYSTNAATNGRFRRIEVKVRDPQVQISARRGYFAMTPEMAAAAAASRVDPAESAVSAAVGSLSTVRPDAALFVSGVATPDGINVRLEIEADAIGDEGWSDGVSIAVVASGAGGQTASETAVLGAGARSAQVTIAAAAVGAGPWRVTARARGRDHTFEESIEIAPSAARLVGEPVAFRAMPSPRSPLQPLADARVSRLERLRVEWPLLSDADTHVVRLLDRTGKALGAPFPPRVASDGRKVLYVDLPISPLSEGDYVMELVATAGDTTERRLLAFRVTR